MERPRIKDDSTSPPEIAPGSDPEPTPRVAKRRSGTLAGNVEVTPLDDEENLKDGIEVKET